MAGKLFEIYEDMLKDNTNEEVAQDGAAVGQRARLRLGMLGNSLDLSGKLLDGQDLDWGSYKGKVVLVDFWATWCPPCRAEIPHFKALQAKYGDVVVIGISVDREGVAAVKPFASENGITYPLLIGDLQTVKAYGNVQSIPTTFVIDQHGRFYSKHVGYKPGTVFERDIQALRNRKNS